MIADAVVEPPPVDLSLHLRNTTAHPLLVWLAGPKTDLRLNVTGPGVKSGPAKERVAEGPNLIELPPGAKQIIHITSLVDDHHSWYFTKSGEYTVSAEFTTRTAAPRMPEHRVTVHSDPIAIPFKEP